MFVLMALLICLGLLGLFQITIERLKCSKAKSGRDGWMDGIGFLYALILTHTPYGQNQNATERNTRNSHKQLAPELLLGSYSFPDSSTLDISSLSELASG